MEFNLGAILPIVFALSVLETLKTKVLGGQAGFDLTPQNTTTIVGQPFSFNCSTAAFWPEGIDWIFSNASVTDYRIFQCQRSDKCFLNNNLDSKTYKLEQPNNLTSNLIVLQANPINAGKYCCQYPNGMRGNMACAYATVKGEQTTIMSTTGQTATGSATGNSNLYALIVILAASLMHLC